MPKSCKVAMLKYLLILFFVSSFLSACERDSYLSPDYRDTELLPDTSDYLEEDYKTQDLAREMSGNYNSNIGLIYYDAETRTIPQLYLTQGSIIIHLAAQESGAVELTFEGFNTAFMPLELSVKIKVLLEQKGDTIFMRGTDGIIRTYNPNGEIGTPLPESDDGELNGYYLRKEGTLNIQLDLMLPIPIKATIKGVK